MTFIPTTTFDENGELEVMTGERVDRGHKSYIKLGNATVTRNDLKQVTVEEAEDIVMRTDFGMLGNPPMKDVTPEEKRAANLRRAGSNIATKAKRGQGNTILYNPLDAVKIEECKEQLDGPQNVTFGTALGPMVGQVGGKDDDDDDEVDAKPRWAYIETDKAPEGKALVMYRSIDDQVGDNAFIYIEDEGLIVNDRYAPVDKYGVFVRL
jgi:hypothetical protein